MESLILTALKMAEKRLALLANQLEQMSGKPTLWRDELDLIRDAIAKAEGK